ncbi:MAG: carboxypeptidase-like regulatory domain-containing protein [Armatimonadota bacterium]
MRFPVGSRSVNGAFRSRDALLVSNPKRNTIEVGAMFGKLVGIAANSDSVEVWSTNKRLLTKVKPSRLNSFTGQFPKRNASQLVLVARSGGRLLAVHRGSEIDNFSDIELGKGAFVTFTTRFVNLNQEPVQVDLFGDVRVDGVTIPLRSKSDLDVSASGILTIHGLPPNGFISLGIHDQEYAQTFALQDIALRSQETRVFPKVRVYPASHIRGKVVDVAGRQVPDTRVVIQSNIRRFHVPDIRTDLKGNFLFSRLPNGVYSVQALSRGRGDMCSTPVSGINCTSGDDVDVHHLTIAKGSYVTFVVDDKKKANTQPVFLEISGTTAGKRWVITQLIFRDRPTRLLVPSGKVYFQASQQPRNGILPSFRNVSVTPSTLVVHPLSPQQVVIQIVQRRR